MTLKMKEVDLDGWSAADTPADGYASEGEFNAQKLVGKQNRKNNFRSGGFQAMGLSQPVLRGILHKGYNVPTPIQRKSIPIIMDGKDVVAMARTGSGKTAAFLVPLFEHLKVHSATGSSIRGLILCPTRELAMQTLNFAKQLGKYTGIRAAVVLGGDSMEIQFQAITENPDIIIATPGRFMHVCVQMKLNLTSVNYVVFDEADRLFEMGFNEQLTDIISRLSPNRQTLLFSATLPKVMVDFARAGLNNPVLIRLDVENKISPLLKMGFFKVRVEEKLSLLLHLLKNVINIKDESTVVFVPTKHFVEYIHTLLEKEGIPNTYIYSSLDPAARKIHADKFRKKKVNLLIVTDVAARGIDIPLLDNVINYNFPAKTKLFIHRVGRVARAGRSGCAFSFVSTEETAYLLELQIFINRAIKFAPQELSMKSDIDWDFMFGKIPRDIVDDSTNHLEKLLKTDYELNRLEESASNSFIKYRKSCPHASKETVRRLKKELWEEQIGIHPLLIEKREGAALTTLELENKRIQMLELLRNNQPKTTIFEVKHKKNSLSRKPDDNGQNSQFMDEKRKVHQAKINMFHRRLDEKKTMVQEKKLRNEEYQKNATKLGEVSEDVYDTFAKPRYNLDRKLKTKKKNKHNRIKRDAPVAGSENNNHFIPYEQADKHTEEALAVKSSFEKEAERNTFDLQNDATKRPPMPRKQWSRTLKKFVGKDMPKKIKTESGVWVRASYTSDIYQKWLLKAKRPNNDEEMGDNDNDYNANTNKEQTQPDANSTEFVTLNKNFSSKKHPLLKQLKGKDEATWNKQGKKKVQQQKSNRELFTYEEIQKNMKHRMKKKRLQVDQAYKKKKNVQSTGKRMTKKAKE